MVKVIWHNFNTFIVIKSGSKDGPKGFGARSKPALKRILDRLEVPEGEQDYALKLMEQRRENIAHFGVLQNGFLYSTYDAKYDRSRKSRNQSGTH